MFAGNGSTGGPSSSSTERGRLPIDWRGRSVPATPIAIAVKDSPGTTCVPLGATLVKFVQLAVPNKRGNLLAVRAECLLEPLDDRVQYGFVAVKPALVGYDPPSPKIVILPLRGQNGGTIKIRKRGAR